MSMRIVHIDDKIEKERISRFILEALPEWFEIEEGRERYIAESGEQLMFAAVEHEHPVGFICLEETGRDTVELAIMGVLKTYQRQGVGRALFEAAKADAKRAGYSFIQVKTVKMGVYEDYDRTNLFYRSLGFKEFEVLTALWDESNPCQVYVMGV